MIEFDASSFETGISSYYSLVLARARKKLEDAGNSLKEKSVLKTPVDTGELRSRAFVSPVDASSDFLIITVGYASESPVYAVYVHERTDVFHKVGQAKFLESALHEISSEFLLHLSEGLIK